MAVGAARTRACLNLLSAIRTTAGVAVTIARRVVLSAPMLTSGATGDPPCTGVARGDPLPPPGPLTAAAGEGVVSNSRDSRN